MINNTIHLNLKRKWFGMILSGEKKEEYRDITPFYDKRLRHLFPQITRNEVFMPIVETVTFSNGYAKDRPQFVIELKGIERNIGKTYWGAEHGKRYYVLNLGKVLKVGRQGFLFNVSEDMSVEDIVDALNL